jgi:hypothetical protein
MIKSSTILKYAKIKIVSIVLYWCKILFLISREEHRVRVFENRVLTRIFGPKRDEIIVEWKILHNE